MKYLALIFGFVTTAAFAGQNKIGDFSFKRYSDDKVIAQILGSDFEELENASCISKVVDSQVHLSLVSAGRYVQALSLKEAKTDDGPTLTVSLEYASVRPKETSILKKTVHCPFSENTDGTGVTTTDGF